MRGQLQFPVSLGKTIRFMNESFAEPLFALQPYCNLGMPTLYHGVFPFSQANNPSFTILIPSSCSIHSRNTPASHHEATSKYRSASRTYFSPSPYLSPTYLPSRQPSATWHPQPDCKIEAGKSILYPVPYCVSLPIVPLPLPLPITPPSHSPYLSHKHNRHTSRYRNLQNTPKKSPPLSHVPRTCLQPQTHPLTIQHPPQRTLLEGQNP